MSHEALLYRDDADYASGVLPFITAGLDEAHRVLVAVPRQRAELIRDGLGRAADQVSFDDLTDIGRNPARIIPTVRRFLDAGPEQSARFIGEPVWAGRSAAEVVEFTRHEAMLNTIFDGDRLDVLCPYAVSEVDLELLSDAWCTHAFVSNHLGRHASGPYADPERMYAIDAGPLGDPPLTATTITIERDDLSEVRELVRGFAARSGLGRRASQDLVLAVNEIATNTLVHTDGPGTLSVWRDGQRVVCQVHDTGRITDPFAGRRLPDQTLDHGRGLWMANQLCDLVQIRSDASGTTVRMSIA